MSPEFQQAAQRVWEKFNLRGVTLRLSSEPHPMHLKAAGVPSNHELLGLYLENPPTIIIFENPIRRVLFDRPLEQAIFEVIDHEVQHHLGLDHEYSRPARCCPGAEGWW